jgi:hypothetical protein
MSELIDDLTSKFLESYQSGDEPDAVESYGHYFLGSIIISDRDGQKFVIDGQQRLTSLTLILIYASLIASFLSRGRFSYSSPHYSPGICGVQTARWLGMDRERYSLKLGWASPDTGP